MNSALTPIQAVLFDYGMVLSAPPDPAAWQHLRQVSGLSEEDFHRGYWAFRHQYDRHDLNAMDYWRQVAASAGAAFTPEQLNGLLAADVALWTQLNAPMLEWARQLQRAGIRTGILSNIGDAMTDGLLQKFDWLCDFYHCTWSYQLRLAKPEAAIYQAAARSMDTSPQNILFIDDKIENIEAAHAVGMQAIQYRDHESFLHEMHERGFADLLSPAPSR